jgi:hypothetical protein
MVASLFGACNLNAVDPHAWLADTLRAIVAGHPQSRVGELPPRSYPGKVWAGRRLHSSETITAHSEVGALRQASSRTQAENRSVPSACQNIRYRKKGSDQIGSGHLVPYLNLSKQ